MKLAQTAFEELGFSVIEADEAFRPIKFWDVGALVWFARIIEWEFPDFNVKDCLENLYRAQEILERKDVIEGKSHRFLLVVKSGNIKRYEKLCTYHIQDFWQLSKNSEYDMI